MSIFDVTSEGLVLLYRAGIRYPYVIGPALIIGWLSASGRTLLTKFGAAYLIGGISVLAITTWFYREPNESFIDSFAAVFFPLGRTLQKYISDVGRFYVPLIQGIFIYMIGRIRETNRYRLFASGWREKRHLARWWKRNRDYERQLQAQRDVIERDPYAAVVKPAKVVTAGTPATATAGTLRPGPAIVRALDTQVAIIRGTLWAARTAFYLAIPIVALLAWFYWDQALGWLLRGAARKFIPWL